MSYLLAFLPYTRWCPLGITGTFNTTQHRGGFTSKKVLGGADKKNPSFHHLQNRWMFWGKNSLLRHSNRVPQSSCNDQESKPSQWTPAFWRSKWRMEVVQKSGDFGTPIYGKVWKRWEISEPHMARKEFFLNVRYFSYLTSLLLSTIPFTTSSTDLQLTTATKNQASKYRKTPAPALPTTHYRGSDLHLIAAGGFRWQIRHLCWGLFEDLPV